MNRRSFLVLSPLGGVLTARSLFADGGSDPWSNRELMEPEELAGRLNASGARPEIISVAFPVMNRQSRIIHAVFAGPGGKPEGIADLKTAVAKLPKNREIVIYCGCCPMEHCPNIRPAYRTLKEMGYTQVRVLHLPHNFREDWRDKGFPTETAVGVPVRPLK